MEEKKLTERESLELISQMIRSTRENMEVGSGNQFLAWGYFSALLSVLLCISHLYRKQCMGFRVVCHVCFLGYIEICAAWT